MNEAPDQLRNIIPEYAVFNKNRATYEELQLWINGWLISHPQEWLGPPPQEIDPTDGRCAAHRR